MRNSGDFCVAPCWKIFCLSVLIVSIRELSSSILLYSPGTEVVSVMIWELWQNGQYVELSALGVMLIITLFCLVMLAQLVGKRFGIAEA